MVNYTIRSTETGAVIMTGYWAETEWDALEEFLMDFPAYEPDEVYASEGNWND